jgi:hypothetical protein
LTNPFPIAQKYGLPSKYLIFKFMKRLTLFIFFTGLLGLVSLAQGLVGDEKIKSIKLYRPGDQTSFPIIQVGAMNELELHFDDLDTRVLNYNYTVQV